MAPSSRPIVWSIAGTDSGGGAGLSADQRAAEALQVHLCPVVSAITAQNSIRVTRLDLVGLECLNAQLETLAQDLPPQVIKTGLIGDAAQVKCIAEWVDRLRQNGPLALVVDPVLGASTGASFADTPTLRAYVEHLLPRATLLTPNQFEAARLLGRKQPLEDIPAAAEALRQQGCESVCITGGDTRPPSGGPSLALDWLATPQAHGWLASPRLNTAHHHGTGCTFATAAASALARGFVSADALVLAKMATWQALRHAQAIGGVGAGAGPVQARPDFIFDQATLPRLSWGTRPHFPAPSRVHDSTPLGLYAIVDSPERLQSVLKAGVRTVQLRLKTSAMPASGGPQQLRQAIQEAIHASRSVQATLFINDHFQDALACGADGLHLGQEDLLALTDEQRDQLAQHFSLGISSHSLWELCRASVLNPRYIACGPVWPTTTKDMPWQPQGLNNLAWWCQMSPRPVVAIGGILDAWQLEQAARQGAEGVCVVRGLGDLPESTVPLFQQAFEAGQASPQPSTAWPHPTLIKVHDGRHEPFP
jgi:hydroxymethylpyrimidine kinase/phosphomethylpyrimidine kinase/thiamine-phosphate diphosphorylase